MSGVPIREVGSAIIPGSVVTEFGESRRMTVKAVQTDGVLCEWFDEGKLKDGKFAFGGLRIADPHAVQSIEKLTIALPSVDTALSWLDKIAILAHEANRIWQALHPSSTVQVAPTWKDAPEYMRHSSIEGVKAILRGDVTTPEQSHESWLRERQSQGWKYGSVKNETTKEHPCFVPYADLPTDQRAKDAIFFHLVRSLIDAHTGA